jgi:type I restriction enzyme S subunit
MMEGCKEYKLGELLEIKYGKDHKKLKDGKYPLYGSGGIMRYVEEFLYDGESILIPRKGTLTNLFYLKKPFSTVDTMFWSKINKEKVWPKFLFYYLKTQDLSLLDEGAAIPSLTTKTLNEFKVNIPKSKATQNKIAKILSSYDDLIENNLKRIKLLEEMAQITYEEWFVRMKFPGHETAVFDEETGLPVGWELVKLGNEVDISSSKRIFLSEYVPNGIPFYRGKEISLKSSNNTLSDILYISEKRYNEIKSKFGGPKKDDILITAVGTIGSSYLVTESDGDFYFKDGNLIWLKGNNNISSRFLIAIFKNEQFRSLLNNIAIGSSQKAITIKSLKAITILKPNKIVLDQFDILMVNTLSQIENLHNQNQRLKEARDILLPRLMTGMIDVDRVEVES